LDKPDIHISKLHACATDRVNGRDAKGLFASDDAAVDSMPTSVTVNTKRNQIFRYIMAELTPGIQMMDFQHFCGTAILATPSISSKT
jgi:hypothetical protein